MAQDQPKVPIENIKDANAVAADRAQREEVRQKVQIAREILSEKSVPDSLLKTHTQKFGREANFVTTIFSILVAGMLLTWYFWEDGFLKNEEDLIYDLGLIGGIMMLLQFVYSARKRTHKMKRFGSLKKWFNVHTFIGLTAPILIIIHSRFELLSINGTVAFISMLLVVFSGIVGRYLYSQVNFDLSGSRSELKKLHMELQQKIISPNAGLVAEIEKPLKAYMVAAFTNPRNVFHSFAQAVGVGIKSKLLYFQLSQMKLSEVSAGNSGQRGFLSQNVSVFSGEEKKLIKNYLDLLARMARYSAYRHLFAMWRIGHVPVIYLLLITGLAHVLAVHMY